MKDQGFYSSSKCLYIMCMFHVKPPQENCLRILVVKGRRQTNEKRQISNRNKKKPWTKERA